MTIMDEIVKRADGAADDAINIADALAKEGGVEKVCGEPIATVMSAIHTKAVIKFNANGGTGDISDFIAVNHEIVPLPDRYDLTAPEGKVFGGWATTDSALVADVTAPYTPTDDATLYALWDDKPNIKPE